MRAHTIAALLIVATTALPAWAQGTSPYDGGYTTDTGFSVSENSLVIGPMYTQFDVTTNGSFNTTSGMFVNPRVAVEMLYGRRLILGGGTTMQLAAFTGVGLRLYATPRIAARIVGRWRPASSGDTAGSCGLLFVRCAPGAAGPGGFELAAGANIRLRR